MRKPWDVNAVAAVAVDRTVRRRARVHYVLGPGWVRNGVVELARGTSILK